MGYDESITFEQLYKGLKKSCRNVRWKDSVSGYELNGLKNTYKLRQALLNSSYRIDEYQRFMIHEPKEREIVATRIKDRQLQRSLCDNIIYPELTKSFIHDNCACLRERGVDYAMNRMEAHLHRYYRKYGVDGWVLQCDIHHYFQSTKHEVAKAAVCKRIKDERVVEHINNIIDSFGDGIGIGLGSQVSQLIELAVMDDLDHYIKERLYIRHYIRYMDDFVLIDKSKERLKQCLAEITKKLSEIGLSLNDKTQIYPLKQGVKFLKWRFVLTDTGKVVRRAARTRITREKRKLRKLKGLLDTGKIKPNDVYTNYQSWRAHMKRGNTHGLVRNMDNYFITLFGKDYGDMHGHGLKTGTS